MKKMIRSLIFGLGVLHMAGAFAESIGVIGAMDVEVEKIYAAMEAPKETIIASKVFYEGTIHGQDVIVVKSGVGKVQAAVTADILAREFNVQQMIFTGVAGSASDRLDIKDIVVADALVQHDVDLTEFGAPKGQLDGYDQRDFATNKELSQTLYNIAQSIFGDEKVHIGLIATGDQFIADKQKVREIHEEFGALAVEMEGAAVAQVADLYQIPFAVLRTVSDKADGSAQLNYEDMKSATAYQSSQILLEHLRMLNIKKDL